MTSLTSSVTLVSPEARGYGLAEANPKQTDGTLPRVPRCRKLDRKLNRCGSEEIEDTGLCAHHLAAAFSDYLRMAGGTLSALGRGTT